MIRGTTPTLRAKIKSDIDLSTMIEIWFTIKSSIHEKTYKLTDGDVRIEQKENVETGEIEKYVLVKMSQQDTLTFSAGKVKIQIRFSENSETAYATKTIERDMGPILKEGIIHG